MAEIQFDGKVAVVTGGSGEIGWAIARAFADEGAATIILDVKPPPSGGAESGVSESGGIEFLRTDLLNLSEIESAVQKITAMHGGIDILVHTAGVNFHKTFFELDEGSWNDTFGVNLKSAFFLAQKSAQSMKARGGGRMIFISSVSAKLGYPGMNDYTASKGGLEALVRNLASELAPYNITVNAIAPGTTKTEMTAGLWRDDRKRKAHEATIPLGRMARPEDHAGPALFLASPMAEYITGAIIPSDGGLSVTQADFIDLDLRGG